MSRGGDFERELARWMARLRESRGLSQEALAAQLRREQPYVSKTENGQRRVMVVDLLEWATALGVPWYELSDGLRATWPHGLEGSLWQRDHDSDEKR